MKISGILTKVRELLRDNSAAVHNYTDQQIAQGAVDGCYQLFSIRPESRYVNGVLTDVEFSSTHATLVEQDIPIPEKWVLGVIYYAAARCYEIDVTDTVNLQLANQMKQNAIQVFQT